jgi:F-type H+-transporting ATPase subunit gamma
VASGKEITSKIKSVENTKKVTSALEMVGKANPEYRHPFTIAHDEVKKVGYVIVSTDRGLCGGLNTNLFKLALADIGKKQAEGAEVSLVTLGKKAGSFFKNIKVEIAASAIDLGEKPQIEALIGSIKVMLDAYRDREVDQVYLVYNDFINTMTQKPTMDQLLPLPPTEDEAVGNIWDYIYEPDAETLLDSVLIRYIEALVYQGVLENLASEHAARMIAMKNATDNAGDVIDELNLAYNKARQAAITQEISEIVGGAAAVSG